MSIVAWPATANALQGPTPGSASASTLKLPDGPSSVRGLADEASTNVFTGHVSYSVPIDLPQGPGGFGPSLALEYSGELGNGPLGIGWSVGSIAIRRSLRWGVPTYTDADELELTGIGEPGRLVPVEGGEYRVEGQGNRIRVQRRNEGFEVSDADGVRYLLGVTRNSREQSDDAHVVSWLAESVSNVVGQQILFTYERDEGTLYLSRIAWAPGWVYAVRLVHEPRADQVVSYRAGFLQKHGRRVDRIEVTAFDKSVRAYELTYSDQEQPAGAPKFPVSRLSRVRMTGVQGSGALPDLTFEYARPQMPATTVVQGLDGWVLRERGATFLDVDGDGMSDLARFEMGNHQYRKNLGARFGAARPISGAGDIELGAAQLMDMDGDARPELVRIVDNTWRVYKLQNATWSPQGPWPGTLGVPLHGPNVALADLNGDGRTDVIQSGTSGLLVNFAGKTALQPRRSLPRISPGNVSVEPGQPNVRFVDVNGDGLADVAWLTDEWMRIYLGRGDGTFVFANRVLWPWGTAAFEVNDVQLGDLNRDGLMDVVRFSGGYVYWYPGLADGRLSLEGRFLDRPESAAYDAVITITDANGNGSEDVVWSSTKGMWVLDLAGPTSAGMLTAIDNGLGKVTRFSYDASAVMAVADENAGNNWAAKLPVSVPVVVKTEMDPGAGGRLRTVRYGVRDGFWDGTERRFGGFLRGTQRKEAAVSRDVLIEETTFYAGIGTERLLRGRPAMVRKLNGAGEVLVVANTIWETVSAGGGRAVLRQAESASAEGVPATITTRTTYDYDSEGRPTIETQHGRLDMTGDEKTIRRQYASSSQPWIRDRVYDEALLSGTGELVSWAQTYYGPPSGTVGALGDVSQGFVRAVKGHLPGAADPWVLQSSTDYDAYGNPTEIYEKGVRRTIGYGARARSGTDSAPYLKPTSETVYPADGRTLQWQLSWDYVSGQPLDLLDPNGDTTTVAYDSLGRPLSLALNQAPAHVHYDYQWEASPPRTTTWVFDLDPADLSTAGHEWPSGTGWRQSIAYVNGAGEALFSATRYDAKWIIGGWKERDERGHVVQMAEACYSAQSLPTSLGACEEPPRIQTAHYDALGRLDTQTLPNGTSKTVVYRAFGQRVSSAELADVDSELDGQQRIFRTVRTVGIDEAVDATYDAGDRILTMTLQGSVVHQFRYDLLGRLEWASDPDTGPRDLVYDSRNLLREHRNGAGQWVFFDYDGAGRLVRRGETREPEAATDYTYFYDDDTMALRSGCRVAGRMAAAVEPARVPGSTEPAGRVALCYDAFGRESGMARQLWKAPGAEPRVGSEEQVSSPSGLLRRITYDDGFMVVYGYDSAGRVSAITDGAQTLWAADALDATGRIESERYGSGATQTYEYDALGLSSRLGITQPASAGGNKLLDLIVERNSYGAPKIVTDLVTDTGLDHNATYSYDGGGRLTQATLGQGSEMFTFGYRYDGLQNMIERTVRGPKQIGVIAGAYHYGQDGRGPRQLTSVSPLAVTP